MGREEIEIFDAQRLKFNEPPHVDEEDMGDIADDSDLDHIRAKIVEALQSHDELPAPNVV